MERFKEETILEFLVQKEFIKLDEENHKYNIYGKQLEKKIPNFLDGCNCIPNWFSPDTRGKRLWKKKLLKGGGKIFKMNKNILIWKH